MAEIETGLIESRSIASSTPVQSFDTHRPSTEIKKPTVPKNNNSETSRKPAVSVRQTKISDMLGASTSTASSSSLGMSTWHQNHKPIESNSTLAKQASGKRVASSPLHAETKRPSVEIHMLEDDWDNIDMDVNVSNPLTKIFKSASIIKYSKIQVKQSEWICSGSVMDETTKHEVEFSSEVSIKFINSNITVKISFFFLLNILSYY